MHAAVVSSFDTAPRFAPFDLPEPGEHELVVDVVAAALHPRVRSQANGSHYTSTSALPLVPGIDGVGRDATGALRYFVLPDTALGSMSESTVIDVRRSVVLPHDADPVLLAAAMNPAMSAWIALRQRIEFTPGMSVLVLGATGSAGALAVQVAHHLGASRVVAVGRGAARLARVGTEQHVALDEADAASRLTEVAADVDVVLDYLWGEPAASVMRTLVMGRSDRGRPLAWVQIGAVAGPTSPIPSEALRAARLQLVGSGQGSVGTREIVGELPALVRVIADGAFAVRTTEIPLRDIEAAWSLDSAERIVIRP
jgi:NADPH:quinone reductase-like Zn-dependent oxidoreductase